MDIRGGKDAKFSPNTLLNSKFFTVYLKTFLFQFQTTCFQFPVFVEPWLSENLHSDAVKRQHALRQAQPAGGWGCASGRNTVATD